MIYNIIKIQFLIIPCGSITYFFEAPLSKSAYPLGASSKLITYTLTALAILILSYNIAYIKSL